MEQNRNDMVRHLRDAAQLMSKGHVVFVPDLLMDVADALSPDGFALVPIPALGVQSDKDAPGVYLRYTTGRERDACVAAFEKADKRDETQRRMDEQGRKLAELLNAEFRNRGVTISYAKNTRRVGGINK